MEDLKDFIPDECIIKNQQKEIEKLNNQISSLKRENKELRSLLFPNKSQNAIVQKMIESVVKKYKEKLNKKQKEINKLTIEIKNLKNGTKV